MKHFLAKAALCVGFVCCIYTIFTPSHATYAQQPLPNAVKIVAPDQSATKVYRQPSLKSEVMDIVLHGVVLEVLGRKGAYVEVKLPDLKAAGYVLETHTVPWEPSEKPRRSLYLPVAIAVIVLAAALAGFLYRRAKKIKEVEVRSSLIADSVRAAEEHFRSGDYASAIVEFNRHLELQGGDVRYPDVYRRLSLCHLKTGEVKEAAQSWEKMRALGGLKTTQDYSIGVEIMTALGKEASAAELYEIVLGMETDEERAYEIHKNLFTMYRRLKNSRKLLEHAIALVSGGAAGPEVYSETVHFLIAEGAADLAIESNSKDIIRRIGQEFLEEKAMTPEAERIYMKCLAFDRMDLRFHRILAEKYKKESNIRKAVGELTILHQLDKERSDEHIEQAAKLYVENSLVPEALAEGNPKIIKKIAQIYLARSEVTPDAVAVYERLVEMQPRLVGVNKMLSTVYLTRGDLQKYMDKLRLLHELDGANHDYLSDLARCIIDNDLLEQTLREGNKDLDARILRHLVKKAAHDEKAIARLEVFLTHEPNNLTALGALAKAYEPRGDHSRHLEVLLALSRLKPDDQETAQQAARIAFEHDLLDVVIRKGHRKVLLVAAMEIVARKLTAPQCVQILVSASKEYPEETRIKKYLTEIQKKPEPTPRPTEGVPSPTAKPARAESVPQKAVPSEPPKEKTQTAAPKTGPSGAPERAAPSQPAPSPGKQPPQDQSPIRAGQDKPVDQPPATYQTVHYESPSETSDEQKQVTTFVSLHERGRSRVHYDPKELFVPASGGYAYKAFDVVASDGWGLWHKAEEIHTERTVLLRVFRKDRLSPRYTEEFVQEVSRLSFNLVHESILSIEDVVTGPGPTPGLICPYLPCALEQVLQDRQRHDISSMIPLIGKIAGALAFACSYRGTDGRLGRTYHLALQPSQVLLNEDSTICKVSGLGYTHVYRNLTKATQPRWQDPGANPAYMAPELFVARPANLVERAVDVYSFGVMCYLMVTGTPPFVGPELDDYRFQHSKVFPAALSLVNPSVPEWLEGIIFRCLEKDPEKRSNSLVEVYEALTPHLRSFKR